jgi:hypothetical protein
MLVSDCVAADACRVLVQVHIALRPSCTLLVLLLLLLLLPVTDCFCTAGMLLEIPSPLRIVSHACQLPPPAMQHSRAGLLQLKPSAQCACSIAVDFQRALFFGEVVP